MEEVLELVFGGGLLAQATDYYPFGKSFENNDVPKNRYLYNGKELQDQVIGGTPFGWYDYGARFYDPELGRWHSVDPLAEKYYFSTPFSYCGNNPISRIDPDGRWSVSIHYKMVYASVQSLGIKDADKIAYMASTYADHPDFSNILVSAVNRGSHLKWSRYGKEFGQGPTANGQADLPEEAIRHCMRANVGDDRTREQSISDGLDYGWNNILGSSISGSIEDLGVGLHAIQDRYAHNGARNKEHVPWDGHTGSNIANFFSMGYYLGKDIMGNTSDAKTMTTAALSIYGIATNQIDGLSKDNKGTVQISMLSSGVTSSSLQSIVNSIMNSSYQGNVQINFQ